MPGHKWAILMSQMLPTSVKMPHFLQILPKTLQQSSPYVKFGDPKIHTTVFSHIVSALAPLDSFHSKESVYWLKIEILR